MMHRKMLLAFSLVALLAAPLVNAQEYDINRLSGKVASLNGTAGRGCK
jgi:hypothetical protein